MNLLQYHLINQQQLSEDALKNADINSDGAITVTDLSLLLKKVEKNLDYNIVLSDVENDTLNPIKMYGRVAMYQIDDLGIEYNYDKYIVKQDATIVNKLVSLSKPI